MSARSGPSIRSPSAASSRVSARTSGAMSSSTASPVSAAASSAAGDRTPCPKNQLVKAGAVGWRRSEEHTSERQSHVNLVCRLLLEKTKKKQFLFLPLKKKKKKKKKK